MSEALSLMYGIDVPCRSVTGLPAEQERTVFLVGTFSLKQDNQVCLLEVDDDWLQITKRSFPHPAGEIWHLSSSPANMSVLATCHSSWDGKIEVGATLWKINDEELTLEKLCSFPMSERCISCEFDPDGQKVAIASSKALHIAPIGGSVDVEKCIKFEDCNNINAIAWDPHLNSNTLAAACGPSVKGFDIRTENVAFSIPQANIPCVRNLDYNPNMKHILATCGDDCCVTLWDTRKSTTPLKLFRNHSHWVWCVKFNPVHDQMLLSVGSDARLFLDSVETLSSESIGSLAIITDEDDEQPPRRLLDQHLEKLEEHEDSIYGCAWAGNDPWIFASVSFDGRVIISRVKRHHKYSILRL